MERIGSTRNPEIDAFFDKALKYDGYDCLIWPFATFNRGHSKWNRLRQRYGTNHVARAICIEVYGKTIDDNRRIVHSCSNPGCVNPKHLKWQRRIVEKRKPNMWSVSCQ
jgi:hypothetical protein